MYAQNAVNDWGTQAVSLPLCNTEPDWADGDLRNQRGRGSQLLSHVVLSRLVWISQQRSDSTKWSTTKVGIPNMEVHYFKTTVYTSARTHRTDTTHWSHYALKSRRSKLHSAARLCMSARNTQYAYSLRRLVSRHVVEQFISCGQMRC